LIQVSFFFFVRKSKPFLTGLEYFLPAHPSFPLSFFFHSAQMASTPPSRAGRDGLPQLCALALAGPANLQPRPRPACQRPQTRCISMSHFRRKTPRPACQCQCTHTILTKKRKNVYSKFLLAATMNRIIVAFETKSNRIH
jgi:hypothetical protein